MNNAPSISAVVITLNEERRLPYALRSILPWVDEAVVVDMHSSDRTTDVAEGLGAKVVYHDRIDFFDGARALGEEKSSGEWLLVLDADELIPPLLSRRLIDLATSGAYDVVEIPRLNYLLGAPLRHTGWGPEQDRQPRLFRRGFVRLQDTLHAGLVVEKGARVATLPYRPGEAIVHFCWIDFTHCIDKLNAYTSLEARRDFQKGQRSSAFKAAGKAAQEFLRRFVLARGYRDGWRGFYLSCFAAMYQVATNAKLKETSLGGSRTARSDTQRLAEQWLSGHDRTAGGGNLPSQPLGSSR